MFASAVILAGYAIAFFVSVWLLGVLIEVAMVPIGQRKRVPFVPTPRHRLQAVEEALNLQEGEILYDLGCGHAGPLTYLARRFGVRGVGYEISFWPRQWAKLNVFLSHAPVLILGEDMHKANLSQANAVFCYLLPKALGELEEKFAAELRPGSRVASYAFALPGRSADKIVEPLSARHKNDERVYVYYY